MLSVSLVCTSFLLAGCVSDTAGSSSKFDAGSVEVVRLNGASLARYQQAVKQNLKDPSSAQFGRYTAFTYTLNGEKQPVAVCGYVNAKNSYGGYGGEQPFIARRVGTTYGAAGPGKYYDTICFQNYGIRP